MRSFSFLPVLATLAFSAFTSAAPSPAPVAAVAKVDAKADVLLARDAQLERRCVPCDYFQGVIGKIEVEVQAIVALDVEASVTVVLSTHLKNIITILSDTIAYIKADATVLVGFLVADVVSLLCTLLGLIASVVTCVLAIVKVLVAADVTLILGLLDQLLCLVGDLVCIILAIVGSLLGDVVAIVGEILVSVVISALGSITGCFALFPDLAGHWPTPCGGSLQITALVSVVVSLIGNVFVLLGINISL
jgi:hypothetical protein